LSGSLTCSSKYLPTLLAWKLSIFLNTLVRAYVICKLCIYVVETSKKTPKVLKQDKNLRGENEEKCTKLNKLEDAVPLCIMITIGFVACCGLDLVNCWCYYVSPTSTFLYTCIIASYKLFTRRHTQAKRHVCNYIHTFRCLWTQKGKNCGKWSLLVYSIS
jgi:hypothetical protein